MPVSMIDSPGVILQGVSSQRGDLLRAIPVKRSIKSVLGGAIFEAGLDALLLKNTAVVVAFHRVHDRAPNGITTNIATFERYCRYFKRHFRVVSLRDLVHKLERREPFSRELAITFDDGYRDNFENAVPVLEKLSLPATFFVVSRWIGTDAVPWWDPGVGYAMSWEQVLELRRRGFDVGAHTRTHVDLGSVSGSKAYDELSGSRLDLERRLAEPVELFAYPYGGRNNLTEANRALAKAAGFRCCCSATGELTTSETDPFRLGRVPISPWYESTHHFGLEVALRRSRTSV
jgi:peptidoglycan/xylan/chitin deacetylase (PgdA/CDA1 family)